MSQLPIMKRNILIDHTDGVPIRYALRKDSSVKERSEHWRRLRAMNTLRAMGYLMRAERSGYTQITTKGREALAVMLAKYADALMDARLSAERRKDYGDALLRVASILASCPVFEKRRPGPSVSFG
jgi:hypothetical protein